MRSGESHAAAASLWRMILGRCGVDLLLLDVVLNGHGLGTCKWGSVDRSWGRERSRVLRCRCSLRVLRPCVEQQVVELDAQASSPGSTRGYQHYENLIEIYYCILTQIPVARVAATL